MEPGNAGRARAEARGPSASIRCPFLSTARQILASSIDYEATLTRVAELTAAEFGSWVVIDLVEENGLRRLATAHADPAGLPTGASGGDDTVAGVPHRVVQTGKAEFHARDSRRSASYICVPFSAFGSIAGAITCATGPGGRQLDEPDFEAMEELARAAGLALDNAMLFSSQIEAHQRSLAFLDTLFGSAPVGLAYWDHDLRYVRLNQSLAAMNGTSPEAHIGRTPSQMLGALGSQLEGHLRNVLETGEPLHELELSGETPFQPGTKRHWTASFYPVVSGSGDMLGVGALVAEITDRKSAEDALRESEERFRLLLEGVKDYAIYMLDRTGRVMSWNEGARRIEGYAAAEIVGQHFERFFPQEDVEHGKPARGLRIAELQGRWEDEGWRVRKDGSRFWASSVITALRGSDGTLQGFGTVTQDTTERKTLEDKLKRQAFHDFLTGLANRELFRNRVEHALHRSARRNEFFSVLYMDLDGFKRINDSLGHAAGDELLRSVARRLESCLRPSDTAARLGGDEFAILLEDIHDESDAVAVAERIIETLKAPLEIHGKEMSTQASVGIVSKPLVSDADEVLRNADAAMYAAKNDGKGGYKVFEASMKAALQRRLQLEGDLRRAVNADEFIIDYQPIVELKTGAITGMEALVRWRHPRLGVLAPSAFIGLAEEMGLIVEIGSTVLHKACRQASAWHQDNGLGLNVNLSPRQFQYSELVSDVAQALAESGLAPQHLTLEITEGLLVQDVEETKTKLEALKGLGVRLAIDDFGTGYSSLSYLRRFPIDVLKIDRSFVERIESGSVESALAGAIVHLGETLNLEAVAEGIETPDQVAELRAAGCPKGQGFHFTKPLGEPDASRLLAHSVAARGLG